MKRLTTKIILKHKILKILKNQKSKIKKNKIEESKMNVLSDDEVQLEKVISSKKKKNIETNINKKIPERNEIMKSLELLLPNHKENISKIEKAISIKTENLNNINIERKSYILEIKIKAQIQLLERFLRVVYCRKEKIKRGDLEEKQIMNTEELEYGIYRKNFAVKTLNNKLAKKKLNEIADKFISGKELDIEELLETFGMKD